MSPLAACVFALACALPAAAAPGWMLADPLAVAMTALTGLVGLTTSISAIASGRRRAERALGQLVIGFLIVALLIGDAGLSAVAIEGAVLAAAWLVRGWSAAAGRRMLVVGGASAALALVGIVLVAGVAGGLAWRDLAAAEPEAGRARLGLGFALVLTGYGALASLLPPQAWLPSAHCARARAVSRRCWLGHCPTCRWCCCCGCAACWPPIPADCSRGRCCSRRGWSRCCSPRSNCAEAGCRRDV